MLTGWGDAVHDALVSPRPPIGDEANELNPRSWMLTVLRHPGVLATVGALLVSAVAGRSLGFGVVTGAGSGLAGGELMGNRADASVLWHAWTDGWTGPGLGGPDPAGPWAPLLALPTWLVDHVPLLPSPGSAAGLVVAILVIAGMPLAAVSAYLALRPVVATRWVRGLAAFGWATTGVAATSVAQGRLGALVALVLLPPVACGLWLMAVRRSTATSAFATALAALVLGAFAPVLLALVTALALVLAVVRSGVRRHALVVAVVPVAVLAPWLVGQAEASWPVLVAGVGLAQWGGPTPEPWQLALLNPGGAGAPLVWTAAPLVAVAVLAPAAGSRLGQRHDDAGAASRRCCWRSRWSHPASAWARCPPGSTARGSRSRCGRAPCSCPLALVVVLALARGLDGVPLRRPASAARLPALGRRTGAAVGAVAVAVSAGGVAWATLGTELAPWQDPRPAVSVDQAEGAFATRALFVVPGTRGAGYRFVGREASDVARPLPSVDRADGSLADRVSAALGDASTGPSLFADTATDLLAVRSGLVPEVARRLDATDGLQPIAPRDGWDMWRVSPHRHRRRPRRTTPAAARDPRGHAAGQHHRPERGHPHHHRRPAGQPARRGRAARLGAARRGLASTGWPCSPCPGRPRPPTLLPVGTGRLVVDVTDPVSLVARRAGAGRAGAGLPRRALRPARVPGGARMSRLSAGTAGLRRGARRVNLGGIARVALVAGAGVALVYVATSRPVEIDLVAADGTAAGAAGRHLARDPGRAGVPRARAGRHPRHARRAGRRRRSRPHPVRPSSCRCPRVVRGDSSPPPVPSTLLSLTQRPASEVAAVPARAATSTGEVEPTLLTGDGSMAPAAAGSQEWRTDTAGLRGLVTTPCAAGGSDLWLLGGGAGPGRQERLILTNPGANPVTTDVAVHGTAGRLGDSVVETVPSGGRVSVLLDARYGKEESPVVRVRSDGGGVQATLTDTWVDGSTPLGADTTVATAPPSGVQVVPGVVVDATGTTSVRVAVPGDSGCRRAGQRARPRRPGAVDRRERAQRHRRRRRRAAAQGPARRHLRARAAVRRPGRRVGASPASAPARRPARSPGPRRPPASTRWAVPPSRRSRASSARLQLVSTGGNSTAEVVTVTDGTAAHPASRPGLRPDGGRPPRRRGIRVGAPGHRQRRAARHGDLLERHRRGPDALVDAAGRERGDLRGQPGLPAALTDRSALRRRGRGPGRAPAGARRAARPPAR